MIPLLRETVERGGQAEMTVTGRSMLPLLKDRISSVRLSRPDALKKGDIVLFLRQDGHYVLHRIVATHGGLYDILGDNQREADRDVPEADILAKVVAYNRSGRAWRKSDALYRAFLPALRTARAAARRLKRKIKRTIRNRSA